MKKIFFVILAIVLITPSLVIAAPPEGPKIIYRVPNSYGEYLQSDTPPIIENDRMLVPIRVIAEALQFDVQWDAVNKQVIIKNENNLVLLKINSTKAYINDMIYILEVPVQIISDRTYVPLSFVSEGLKYNVYYEDTTQTGFVTYDKLLSKSEIESIFNNRENYIFNTEEPSCYLLKTGALPSGIKIGDSWDKVKQIYGRPWRVYINGEILTKLPNEKLITETDKCQVSYSSAFMPYSDGVVTLHFYFEYGILVRVNVSFL